MPLKLAAVSYLNTKPFIFGLQHFSKTLDIDLNTFEPHLCAQQLINNQAQVGLVPVAALSKIPNAQIISNYCIGAIQQVDSVLILSQVPIENISHLYLDYQSRTSVALAQILLKHYWKKEVILLKSQPGFENKINQTTAAVIIGDRALHLKHKFSYCYDLATAWHSYKQLPFMFAAWVSTVPLSKPFIDAFNQACATGIEAIPTIDALLKTQPGYYNNTLDYLTNKISYHRTPDKMEALKQFTMLLDAL